jgi:assimilatory nitrate reductase electron transfer subunit
VLDGERVTAATLVGDTSAARRLSELLRSGAPVPADLLAAGTAAALPPADDPAATLCSCNAVSVGDVQAAIRRDGLRTVAQVGLRTRATTGCGGCTDDVRRLLDAAAPSA